MLGVQKITVRRDDNLKTLAERFGPSPDAWPVLVAANPHKARTAFGTFETLTPGEKLILPFGWRIEPPTTPAPSAPALRSFDDAQGIFVRDVRGVSRPDAGALSAEDASKGAAVAVGATVAVGSMLLAPRAGLGIALVLGSVAAIGVFLAVQKATA